MKTLLALDRVVDSIDYENGKYTLYIGLYNVQLI